MMVAGMLSRYFAYLFFLSAYRGALLPGRVDRRLPLARLLLFDEKVTAPCCTTRKFVDFAGGPAKRSWIGRTKSGGVLGKGRLGLATLACGEGFALVRKYDVAPEVFLDVMTDGLFACSAYKVYGKIIAEQRYQPAGQRAVLGLKDANLALAAGEAVGVPLPSGNVWRDRLVGALAHGEGEHDWAVMARDQARASGLE
jgi:hypothetical protein